MLKKSEKYFLIVLVTIVLSISLFIAFRYFDRRAKENFDKTEKLVKNVVSTVIAENNKLFSQQMRVLSEEMRTSLKRQDGKVTDIGISVASAKQTAKTALASSKEYRNQKLPTEQKDPNEYKFTIIRNKENMPIAWAMYYPNRPKESNWKVGTYPMDIKSEIVLTKSKKEKEDKTLINMWAENNQMQETKGKKFPLEVKEVKWVRREIKDNSWMWNLRGSVGVLATLESGTPLLSLSTASYGKTNRDFNWRVLGVDVGYDRDSFVFGFTPVQYNLGEFLPLVENLYMGPTISVDSYLEILFGVSIGVLF